MPESIAWEPVSRASRSLGMTPKALPLALLTIVLAACSVGAPSPSPAPTPSPSPQPSPSPSTAFYLRAWFTQSIPPRGTFNWLAMATIADGVFLDGNVAIDLIFPGPLTILPVARQITPNGIATLIDVRDRPISRCQRSVAAAA